MSIQINQATNSTLNKIELPKVNIETLDEYPICYTEYKLPPNYVK